MLSCEWDLCWRLTGFEIKGDGLLNFSTLSRRLPQAQKA